MDGESGLTERKRRFVSLMAQGTTQYGAAVEMGISERQARRMYGDPLVRAAIRDAQRDALENATRRLAAGTVGALGVIWSILRDDKMGPYVRLRAAEMWLSAVFRFAELYDLDARISALEQQAKGANHGDAESKG